MFVQFIADEGYWLAEGRVKGRLVLVEGTSLRDALQGWCLCVSKILDK